MLLPEVLLGLDLMHVTMIVHLPLAVLELWLHSYLPCQFDIGLSPLRVVVGVNWDRIGGN